MGSFKHIPVMPDEVIEHLAVKRGGTYLDGTCGGGGHSLLIAEKLMNTGRLFCVDRDGDAINAAKERLKGFSNITFIKDNFGNFNMGEIDGALLDLGVSSWQLDEPSRGFSFLNDAPLDMRMDKEGAVSAADIANNYSESDLRRVIGDYGEERFAYKISSRIIEARGRKKLETTLELADLVSGAIPKKFHEKGKHPATRTFQALRIEVNNELSELPRALNNIVERLSKGGRLAVISFHSLEDRIVKNTFKTLDNPCECPKSLPYCVCGKMPKVKIITKRPIAPSDEEINENPRARSAKLRVAEKL